MTTKELLALVADWRRAAHQLRGDCEPMPASAMRLDECADELEAALSVAQGQGWLPIESAPKNRPVLIWNGRRAIAAWFQDDATDPEMEEGDESDLDGYWCIDDGKLGPFAVRGGGITHWRELPAAPAQPDGVG